MRKKLKKATKEGNTYIYPSIEFVAGLIVAGTLTIADTMGEGKKVHIAWGKVLDGEHAGCHDVRFRTGTTLRLSDFYYTQAIVESYDWEWVDVEFEGNGVAHIFVKPMKERFMSIDPADKTQREIIGETDEGAGRLHQGERLMEDGMKRMIEQQQAEEKV